MLKDYPSLGEIVALQYAVSIQTCCRHVKGYTLAELAIEQNAGLSSTFSGKLPALEAYSTSSILQEHLTYILLPNI